MESTEKQHPLGIVSEKTRLKILQLLLDQPKTVSELRLCLDMEKSLLSKHLRILRESGIVFCTEKGRHRVYQLSPKHLTAPRSIEFDDCTLNFH